METTDETIGVLEIVRELIEERRNRLGVSMLNAMAATVKSRKLRRESRIRCISLRIAE